MPAQVPWMHTEVSSRRSGAGGLGIVSGSRSSVAVAVNANSRVSSSADPSERESRSRARAELPPVAVWITAAAAVATRSSSLDISTLTSAAAASALRSLASHRVAPTSGGVASRSMNPRRDMGTASSQPACGPQALATGGYGWNSEQSSFRRRCSAVGPSNQLSADVENMRGSDEGQVGMIVERKRRSSAVEQGRIEVIVKGGGTSHRRPLFSPDRLPGYGSGVMGEGARPDSIQPGADPSASARTVSIVSASPADLSSRYRTTRANRSASPPG